MAPPIHVVGIHNSSGLATCCAANRNDSSEEEEDEEEEEEEEEAEEEDGWRQLQALRPERCGQSGRMRAVWNAGGLECGQAAPRSSNTRQRGLGCLTSV
jgi:hypothetical protein